MKAAALLSLSAMLVIVVAHPAPAQNSIVVESRTLAPAQTACTVGVFISNSVPLSGLLFQLETRSMSGGAYFIGPVGTSFFRVRSGGRVDNSPLGTADSGGAWVGAAIARRRFSTPYGDNQCSGPISHTWAENTISVDGISPDAIEYATVSQSEPGVHEFYELAAGSETGSRDNASFFFLFDANGSPGCFEIDSCCTTPSNHIGFQDESLELIIPSFTKGVVCIEGDPVNLPPVITCPADINLPVTFGDTGAVVHYSVTVLDEIANLAADCEPPSGSFFLLGTTLVTCIATDTAGLADTCTFDVTVTELANRRPFVDCPSVVSATVDEGEAGTVVNFAVAVIDDGPPLMAVCTPPSGSFFSVGETLVECVAEDAEGLADTCFFYVYVSDLQSSAVYIESRNFLPGQTACSVGVFITNHLPIVGIVMPLEIRSVSGGAFYKGPIGSSFFRSQAGRRLDASPLGSANLPLWPPASITNSRFDTVSAEPCGGSAGNGWSAPNVTVGGTSPDAVLFSAVSQGDASAGQLIALETGADIAGSENASLVFAFDIDTLKGCFEIDTTCRAPSGHLIFATGEMLPLYPSFTKGTVCITNCACACNGNPSVPSNPDINVLDVVYTANVAFRNSPVIPDTDPLCPVGATDVNCDGVTTIVDMVKMIEVAFRNGNPATVFCNPCP